MSLDAFFAAQLARIDQITNQRVARVRARTPVHAEDDDEHLDPDRYDSVIDGHDE